MREHGIDSFLEREGYEMKSDFQISELVDRKNEHPYLPGDSLPRVIDVTSRTPGMKK
jgi:hypothetical protein